MMVVMVVVVALGLLASAGGEDGGIAATANGQKKLSRSSLDEQSLLLGSPLLENSQTSQADFGFVVVGKDKTQWLDEHRHLNVSVGILEKFLSANNAFFTTMNRVMKVKMLGGRNWKKRYSETSDIEDTAVLPYQRCVGFSNS
ncbi:unnamed protein product [Brugia pahangi]|uniref:Secreted RxLR effector peptide protein n=1 Tax=Brugia pahangi TaxID=6280 RepID=A0A0N4SYV4_BRUPA|nr:unnamed protein product [Brugia pahangi]